MSSDINLSSLRKELQQALKADQKYERENDAKFRAINQKVATYDEFRDIVKASHLQPLEKKEIVGGPRNQPWNAICSTSEKFSAVEHRKVGLSEGCGLPTNGQELIRQWRRFRGNEEARYQMLLSLPPETHSLTLKTEASTAILGEVILNVAECFKMSDIKEVLCILTSLSQTPRFSLSLVLFTKTEQEAVQGLFDQLSSSAGSGEHRVELEQLRKVYQHTS